MNTGELKSSTLKTKAGTKLTTIPLIRDQHNLNIRFVTDNLRVAITIESPPFLSYYLSKTPFTYYSDTSMVG